MKKILIFLSLFFTVFSLTPSLFEIYHAKDLPKDRAFVLEHNYMFDYNFYLSRIKQGQEGRWLVVEKYYNKPHKGSLFQIFYLYIGKISSVFNLSPPVTYHLARFILGFTFLYLIGKYASTKFNGIWQVVAFLIIVTSGSWPILIKTVKFWRFATYMGWWSAVDSLQRVTFMPHVVLGQIFILVFIWKLTNWSFARDSTLKLILWAILGFVIGIIFPPTLIVIYAVFGLLSLWEFISDRQLREFDLKQIKKWIKKKILPRFIFFILSFPSFIYLQLMFRVWPWRALMLFDIEHRMLLPYKEYAMALGPILPLGLLGLVVVLVKKERKYLTDILWIFSIISLFVVFEHIPMQSSLRFTEAVVHIPLGILATFLFYCLWKKRLSQKGYLGKIKIIKGFVAVVIVSIIGMGILVMISMIGWLTDQKTAKRHGTFVVPSGAQLVYPLKDFMDAIYFIRDNTKVNEVVLAYEAAGNYIGAYAGNFVYLGHANTPNEKDKKRLAGEFFSGKMDERGAKEFLDRENISYIYFGPQEKTLANTEELSSIYPFVLEVYRNGRVIVYKIKN